MTTLVTLLIAIMISPGLACAQDASSGSDESRAAEIQRPQARSEQERADFTSAYATRGAAAMEMAANDFSVHYPESQLRRYLYSAAMVQYQGENNPEKILAMGEHVLALDPEDPLALVLTATVLADGLGDHDRDRERKVSAIKRNATHAIRVAGTGFITTAGDRSASIYGTTLQAMAYSALGLMKLKTGDDAGAEKDLKIAAETATIKPNPYVWYHLALAQDHRKKYKAALGSVQQALQLSSSNLELQKLAEAEHERLSGLTRGLREETGDQP